jgi:hypothetical protein
MEGWSSRPSRSGTSEEDDDLIILASLRDSNFPPQQLRTLRQLALNEARRVIP